MVFFPEQPQRETKDGEHVSPLESRTRSRVLHMVSSDGPVTADSLAALPEVSVDVAGERHPVRLSLRPPLSPPQA